MRQAFNRQLQRQLEWRLQRERRLLWRLLSVLHGGSRGSFGDGFNADLRRLQLQLQWRLQREA